MNAEIINFVEKRIIEVRKEITEFYEHEWKRDFQYDSD